MLLIAILGTVAAALQNILILGLAAKELDAGAAAIAFARPVAVEAALIWAGYLLVRRFVPSRRVLAFGAYVVGVLVLAEAVAPVGLGRFTLTRAAARRRLARIEVVQSAVRAPVANRPSEIALDYALRFPTAGRYLTFPAFIGEGTRRIFGDYDTTQHAAYFHDDYVFDAGKAYAFSVRFPTELARAPDSSAKIQICDSKEYSMSCRLIAIRLRP